MTTRTLALIALFTMATPPAASAQQYTARQIGDIVQLEDAKSHATVSIIPSAGNITSAFTVNGLNVVRWPYSSVDEAKARGGLNGIPLLAPWANRLDEQAFYANGKRYAFDMQLGNVKGEIPIHGFLSHTDKWQVKDVQADGSSAWVTSVLLVANDPMWIMQWPFAHRIAMTHRLQEGVLQVQTTITNLSAEPMPVAIGFHPYFQLSDAPRDEWTISVGAKTHWKLSPVKIPTGDTEAIESLMPEPGKTRLKDYNLDDVFGDLVRDAQGRATMSVVGKKQRLDVVFGPTWKSVVIYSPNTSNFICFEPMAGITDALNLAHKGLYNELQYIQPHGTWDASFWVKPSGF